MTAEAELPQALLIASGSDIAALKDILEQTQPGATIIYRAEERS